MAIPRAGPATSPAGPPRSDRQNAQENPTWGERRIAAELLVKLGLRVSPRTIRRYMPKGTGGIRRGATAHRWRTFLRNHASVLLAADFCVVRTVRFRVLYVIVVMQLARRWLEPVNGLVTRRRRGPCRSSGQSSRDRTTIASSSTIATASTRPGWTPLLRQWAFGSSGHRSIRRWRTGYASGSSEVYAASAWTSSFH